MKAIVWVGAVVALTAGCSKSESESSGSSSSAAPTAKPAATPSPVQPAVQNAAKLPPGPPVPTEPAVLTASITQDGKTCTATIDKDCVECLQKESKELPDACDSFKGNATAGPGAGASKSKLCHEALDCMRRTSCHANSVIDCYCGKMTGGECVASTDPKGACRKELDRALEIKPGSMGSAALDILTEISNPGGAAGLTATAESTGCAKVCLPYKATACK